MKHDQMLMDRTRGGSVEDGAGASTIKTILFHVHSDVALDERLEAALSIARTFGAHLHLLHVTPTDAYTVVDAFGTFVSPEIIRTLEADAGRLRARLEARLGEQDVSWGYEEVTGSLMPSLIERAALADLLVLGRESKSPEFEGRAIALLGEILYRSRTPLLVLGDDAPGLNRSGPAVVAWNGSYEAANALRASVPLLRFASDVVLLTIEEAKGMQIPGKQAREYLSRQGIESRIESRPQLDDSIAEDILGCAIADGASCIVTGGYGHSRAGELLFGGVTRSLLKSCALPVLLAH